MPTKQVSVSLDDDFIEQAEKTAAMQHRSLSGMLAYAIYSFFGWQHQELEDRDDRERTSKRPR